MSDFLVMIVSVSVVLGVMVLVHEWGHFIVAKSFGVRVEIFSIGFGTRLWGLKRGDTDYRVSALPLGGYVKMAGDNPLEERKGDPDEFLSKPRWQRVLIALAGPAMNIVLSIVILSPVFTCTGASSPHFWTGPWSCRRFAGFRRAKGGPRCRGPHHQGKRREQSDLGSSAVRVDVDFAGPLAFHRRRSQRPGGSISVPAASRWKMSSAIRRIPDRSAVIRECRRSEAA